MEIDNDITKKGKNISGFYGYMYRYIYLIINALILILKAVQKYLSLWVQVV